jgi:hypothetical protein
MSEPAPSLAVDFPPLPTDAERRALPCQPAAPRASFRVLGSDVAGRAELRNLSALGAGLLLPRPVGLGALLQLEFDGLRRPLLARVIHTTDEPGLVGCAFVRELDDATMRLFHAHRLSSAVGDDRRWVRFPCNVETVCRAGDAAPGERVPARIVSISAGGMALLLPCEFRTGTLLKLDLERTAARSAGPLLLRAVRAAARAAGNWLLGCEFADPLHDEELKALAEPTSSRPDAVLAHHPRPQRLRHNH